MEEVLETNAEEYMNDMTVDEYFNEYAVDALSKIKPEDQDFAQKVKAIAELQKNSIEMAKVRHDNENNANRNRNDWLRNVVALAGVAVTLVNVACGLGIGLRATAKEENYEHSNREGLSASRNLLSGVFNKKVG